MTSTSGVLYVVATPIGNLGDITERAKHILQSVSLIAAEDTRHTGRLLQHLGITNKLISLHDHNERQKASFFVEKLSKGNDLALVSDAGTPLISDPGYFLVREVRAAGLKVVPIPGACALISALSASGLATDSFVFEGFLAAKTTARQKQLALLKNEPRTMVFYESTHRILDSLNDMSNVLGEDRLATVARELTKTFETINTDSLKNLIRWMEEDSDQKRGEFVVIVSGNPNSLTSEESEADRLVDIISTKLPLAQATSLTAEITGERKKTLYQRALLRRDES
ncbi:MAG: 16S rRNA (cytidine(1402)-2'-O)-methyltransferase [Gammaproteobacteria bacterium]|nr:MAG: 16S rRNA (cytidine(1402)-2'-O)-methyltransferase [Gammaproteobacteria bacterium]